MQKDTFAVGDIVVTNFGVTMLLPTLYKVTKRTAKTFTAIAMGSKQVSGDGMTGRKVPTDDLDPMVYLGVVVVRIKEYAFDNSVVGKLAKHRLYFYPWDGQPAYFNHMD